jgi:hypothetical protein
MGFLNKKYIANVCVSRGDGIMIKDIDDTRNALLLQSGLHAPWGSGELAILKVIFPYNCSYTSYSIMQNVS